MGKYEFIGTEPRVFGDLSLRVEPGQVAEFDGEPPGGEVFWKPVADRRRVTAGAASAEAEAEETEE